MVNTRMSVYYSMRAITGQFKYDNFNENVIEFDQFYKILLTNISLEMIILSNKLHYPST